MATDTHTSPTRTLDVRTFDGDPFGPLTDALADLDPGETLLLVNSFEPVPLYDVLDRREFDHETTRAVDDEWHVRIEHA